MSMEKIKYQLSEAERYLDLIKECLKLGGVEAASDWATILKEEAGRLKTLLEKEIKKEREHFIKEMHYVRWGASRKQIMLIVKERGPFLYGHKFLAQSGRVTNRVRLLKTMVLQEANPEGDSLAAKAVRAFRAEGLL